MGASLTTRLLHLMLRHKLKRGVLTLCIGRHFGEVHLLEISCRCVRAMEEPTRSR
jgi:acetyl-CoA acetyltransferase